MPPRFIGPLVIALFGTVSAAFGALDILVADFEGTDYGAWQTTGTAFVAGPAHGTLPNQMAVDGFLGKGLVNSFAGGDSSIGTLTSPAFTVERPYIQFLAGGGKFPGQTCINLIVSHQVVRTATGPNDKPGGSEHLDWQEWEVGPFAGQQAQIQIVDQATGGWGHITIDQIIQTDRPLPVWLTNVTRTLVLEQHYLHFPVKNGAPRRLVSLLVDGQTAREFEIELADRNPDFWAFLELDSFKGKPAVLKIDKLREDSSAPELVSQSDTIKDAENLYQEKLRPQFHFTSRRGWNNDPNGLVYLDGEYHLFYQHNPYGWNWGNMHWGHAVSPDLLHWRELGEALYPDKLGTMFSGSAVVDTSNTAGFARDASPALVCIYTAAGSTSPASQGQRFSQGLAYSTDRGRSWTKYQANPVLPHIAAENRDPKVIWFEPHKQWIMALYLDKSDYALFSSPDLKQWTRLSDVSLPGSSECPEFFPLPVEGAKEQTRWIFYGGNGRYLIGTFDGQTFRPESGPHSLHFGNCFYASQTFNNIPVQDGRRILIGWGQVNLPGMPFNQMMDLPVELTLRKTESGLRLCALPVREIEKLRGPRLAHSAQLLEPGEHAVNDVRGELLDVEAEFEPGTATEVGLKLYGVSVTYNSAAQELTCLGKKAPLALIDVKVRLRLLADRASIEIFGNDGRLYMPMGTILNHQQPPLAIMTAGGQTRQVALTVYPLESVWKKLGL